MAMAVVCFVDDNSFSTSNDESFDRFEEVYRWKQMTFKAFDNVSIIFELPDGVHDLDVNSIIENYIPSNNVPIGAVHHKKRLFITFPRIKPGIPATLTHITTGGVRKSSPSLEAYPDFKTNEIHVSKISLI